VSANGKLKPAAGWTDKFIFPEYDFKICNAMITNFHMICLFEKKINWSGRLHVHVI